MMILAGCSNSQSSSNEEKEGSSGSKKPVELLNVSYDPTRELYQEFN
ncbi:MAG TPA: sulfate transporter subunit, partial [Ureibacillus sp.]|nr:sulfate transporter subunit [Ureibacillus sp.]